MTQAGIFDVSFVYLLRACDGTSAPRLAKELDRCTPFLEKLLDFPGKNAASRKTLEEARAPFGVQLNSSEKTLVKGLSDGLNLDEQLCVSLVVISHRDGVPLQLETVAHKYFEERAYLLMSLLRLLQLFLGYYPATDAAVGDVAAKVLTHLISTDVSDRVGYSLLSRLCAISKDESQVGRPGGILQLQDPMHGPVSRETMARNEQQLACEALFHLSAALGRRRPTPADTAAVASVLKYHDSMHRRVAPVKPATFGAAVFALHALVTLLMPAWPSERTQEEVQFARRVLPGVDLTPEGDDSGTGGPFLAVARLAYGLAVYACDDGADIECVRRGVNVMAEGLAAGAIRFMGSLVRSPAFTALWPDIRRHMACLLLQLLLHYGHHAITDAKPGNLIETRRANVWDLPAQAVAPQTTAALIVPPATLQPEVGPADSVLSHLLTLAVLLSVQSAPGADAVLSGDLPMGAHEEFGNFMSLVAKAPTAAAGFARGLDADSRGAVAFSIAKYPAEWAAPAKAAYLHVLEAYAASPTAARRVVLQLAMHANHDEYAHLSWQNYFEALTHLHARYIDVTHDAKLLPQDERVAAATFQERAVLVAYTNVLAQGLRALRAPEHVVWTAELRDMLRGALLAVSPGHPAGTPQELLMQVMCEAVPQDVKAAADSALAAFVTTQAEAAQLLQRLQTAQLVAASRLGVNLSGQISRVAELEEDYTEPIAFVRMFNTICELGGVQLMVDEAERVSEHTEFIMYSLLAKVGSRRYHNPVQLYEQATVCLRHLTLCVKALQALSGRQSLQDTYSHPGHYVLAALLAPQGVLLTHLLTHVIEANGPRTAPEAVDRLVMLCTSSSVGPAAEAAAQALLELLVAIFDVDTLWLQAQPTHRARVLAPLHTVLLSEPRWTVQLLQFVRMPDNVGLQVAALRVMGQLARRDLRLVHILLGSGDHVTRLVQDCGLCLQMALAGGSGAVVGEADDEEPTAASLLLNVLLDNASRPFPNLTQLLLGYNMQQGAEGLAYGPDRSKPSCTAPFCELLAISTVTPATARLHGAAWHVVHNVTATRMDADALLRMIVLDGVLLRALQSDLWAVPTPEETAVDSNRLFCKAWVLGTLALHIQVSTSESLQRSARLRSATEQLIMQLYPSASSADVRMPGHSRLLSSILLRSVVGELAGLDNREFVTWWERQQVQQESLEALNVWDLLQQTAPVEKGGILVYDALHRVWLYEGSALKGRLQALVKESSERADRREVSGAANAALSAVFEAASRWNTWQLAVAACTHLVRAWVAVVTLTCCSHPELCADALAREGGGGAGAVEVLGPLMRELVSIVLEQLEPFMYRLKPSPSITLQSIVPAGVVHLMLQCCAALIMQLGSECAKYALRHEDARAMCSLLLPAHFCFPTATGLLRIAKALNDNHAWLDDRAELSKDVHVCLLSYFTATRPDALVTRQVPDAGAAWGGRLSAGRLDAPQGMKSAAALQAEVCAANLQALQVDGLAHSLVASMRPRLDAAAAAPTPQGEADPSIVIMTSQGTQHLVALHTLASIMTCDQSGALCASVDHQGVLSAVLRSLGEATQARLMAPVHVRTLNFSLTLAHLQLLQTFATPSNATQQLSNCRTLVSRGALTHLRKSRLLQLNAVPMAGRDAATLAHVVRVRTAALQLLLTVLMQLASNQEVLLEGLRMVAARDFGCLGEYAASLVKHVASAGVHPLELRQSEVVVALAVVLEQHLASGDVNAPAEWLAELQGLRTTAVNTLYWVCTKAQRMIDEEAAAGRVGGGRALVSSARLPGADVDMQAGGRAGGLSVDVSREGDREDIPVVLVTHCVDMLLLASQGGRLTCVLDPNTPDYLRDTNSVHVYPLTHLLLWLWQEIQVLQAPAPSTGVDIVAYSPAAAANPTAVASGRMQAEAAQRKLQCTRLAERALSCVLVALKHEEAGLLARTSSEPLAPAFLDRMQEFLQRCLLMLDKWEELVDRLGAISSLHRAVRDHVNCVRELCQSRSDA